MAMGTDAVAKTDMKKDYFPVGALAPLQLARSASACAVDCSFPSSQLKSKPARNPAT